MNSQFLFSRDRSSHYFLVLENGSSYMTNFLDQISSSPFFHNSKSNSLVSPTSCTFQVIYHLLLLFTFVSLLNHNHFSPILTVEFSLHVFFYKCSMWPTHYKHYPLQSFTSHFPEHLLQWLPSFRMKTNFFESWAYRHDLQRQGAPWNILANDLQCRLLLVMLLLRFWNSSCLHHLVVQLGAPPPPS